MARKTLVHKGYHGSIKVNNSDFSLFGEILFIEEEGYNYAGESFEQLEESFKQAVEKHINGCKEAGIEPPFSE